MGFQNPHFCISTPENPSEMKSADLTVRRCMCMYVCMYVKNATPLGANGLAENPHHEVAVTSWGCNNIKMLQHQLDVAERCWCMHVCMYVRTYMHTSPRYGYIHTCMHRLDTCVRTYPPVARRRNTRKSSFDTHTKSADESYHLNKNFDFFNSFVCRGPF